jgi:hypothetical protein
MEVINWLLEEDNPSVRYRTLTELLDMGESPEAGKARAMIPGSKPVVRLLEAMQPDGYWLQKNSRGELVGDGAEYGSFGTTHFVLSYLAELGLDRQHPVVAQAAERYLSLQKDDGDWYRHLSCLYGYNIRTFIKLGYRNDAPVQKVVDLMLRTERPDGGYLCDMHEKHPGKRPKSCVRGAVKALLAFAELPEYWEHERCRQLADYFLNRNGIFRSKDLTRFVNNDMTRDSYPIVWRTNVWEVLYALSKMGYGRDERLIDAWAVLDSRENDHGRYLLDWTPAQCPWKVGKPGEENKWVTLYVLLAKKHAGREFSKQI